MGQGVSGHHLNTSGGNGDKSSQKDLFSVDNSSKKNKFSDTETYSPNLEEGKQGKHIEGHPNFKEEKTDSISKGYTVQIKGDRLKVAGNEESTGLFFAPCDAEGKKDEDRANWVHIRPSSSMENTAKTLCVNLPADMKEGTYRLIVSTAFGAGKRLNKSVRDGEYSKVVTVS